MTVLAEICLLIYPYLLISEARRTSTPANRNYIKAPKIFVIRAFGSSRVIFRMISSPTINTKDVWPEILRTCQLIHKEALPFINLYGQARLSFVPCDCTEDTENQYLSTSCGDFLLESYRRRSTFAAFLAQIGQEMAKDVSYLEFNASDCDSLTVDLPLITRLCEQYLPGLISVRVYIAPPTIHWSESPEYWHPDHSSPFWTNEQFRPMYEALKHFVDRIGWLKQFEYRDRYGLIGFGSVDNEPVTGLGLLEQLETKVEERKGMGVAWTPRQPHPKHTGFKDGVEQTCRSMEE